MSDRKTSAKQAFSNYTAFLVADKKRHNDRYFFFEKSVKTANFYRCKTMASSIDKIFQTAARTFFANFFAIVFYLGKAFFSLGSKALPIRLCLCAFIMRPPLFKNIMINFAVIPLVFEDTLSINFYSF
ncbi:hypothetical protein [Bartonella sp. B1099]|uniref:hypothetical protein n=1 Tax=Bartonella sp. B1099 TaxID=2911422 RepID=UPI0020C48127|nr:hypothetical protein [Bartonella sp. B1099]